MTFEYAQTLEDIWFTSASFVLCSLAAITEALHQPQTWVASDVWKTGELSPLHWLLAVLSVASCVYWLVPPGLYGGVLAGPALILLPIVTLTTFAGLPHLLLWTVILHHTPNVLLGLLRVALWRGRDASPAQQALAGLCLVSLLPLWFVTRVYWYSQLLRPSLLKSLPDNVVVIGLVVHVLLWILGAINLRHYWRLIKHCWRYLVGDLEEIGDVFDFDCPPPAAPDATEPPTNGHRQDGPPAHVNEHQKNMKLIYHTIMTMTRLKRKIRRRRAARAAAAAAAAAAEGSGATPDSAPLQDGQETEAGSGPNS